jgi:hypothetical protein
MPPLISGFAAAFWQQRKQDLARGGTLPRHYIA